MTDFKKKTKLDFAQNLEKTRLYFLSHPDIKRKSLGMLICDNYQSWQSDSKTAKEIIGANSDNEDFSISGKTFELIEKEFRALIPKDQRGEIMSFINALKTLFQAKGML